MDGGDVVIGEFESLKRLGLRSEKSYFRFVICEISVVRSRDKSRTSGLYLDETEKYVGKSGANIKKLFL